MYNVTEIVQKKATDVVMIHLGAVVLCVLRVDRGSEGHTEFQ